MGVELLSGAEAGRRRGVGRAVRLGEKFDKSFPGPLGSVGRSVISNRGEGTIWAVDHRRLEGQAERDA